MYEYEIIDVSQEEKSEVVKEGVASLDELSHILPEEIYGQLKTYKSLELEIQAGSEIYRIKKKQ